MKQTKLLLTSLSVSAALLIAGIPNVASDHRLEDGSRYDHRVGNEWWVEVRFTAPDGWDPEHFEILARSEKSPTWHPLTLRSWGNYAGSFHIPPGERVQFQAARAGSMSWAYLERSCFFTHPAGVEQCDPGSRDELRATFSNPSGNEWWQQVFVKTNHPANVHLYIYHVDRTEVAQMALKSWGGHAVSKHAPQGTWLQFVASSGYERAESPCYRWFDAAVVDCPPSAPVAMITDNRFDHKGGNEWWVEVKAVTPHGAPGAVQARDEGGPWVPLTLRSWGTWANSFHIEPGHKVQFRLAQPNTQDWVESCWYSHPQGYGDQGLQVCTGRYPQ